MELINRLDNVIKKDKKTNPQYMKEVLKSDIFDLLNNYFDVNFSDINIDIDLNNSNLYLITINALGDRMKTLKILPR